MKKAILLLFAIILANSIYASCDITDTINQSKYYAYSIGGKDYNISLSSLKNDSGTIYVKFKINTLTTPDIEQNEKYSLIDSSEITPLTIMPGSVNKAEICFNAGLSCINCGTCSSFKECDDNNSCTIDSCDGDPPWCKHKLILWCRDSDSCCPSKCKNEEDNDCARLAECSDDSECDDNNTITKDICSGQPKKCSNTNITECLSGDNYCPDNCTFTLDTDCDECLTNEECNDNNPCTYDTCIDNPKKCFNNETLGCILNDLCISIGDNVEDNYCDTDKTFKPLKSKNEPCTNNYECMSERCVKNTCWVRNPIKAIKDFFSRLFKK